MTGWSPDFGTINLLHAVNWFTPCEETGHCGGYRASLFMRKVSILSCEPRLSPNIPGIHGKNRKNLDLNYLLLQSVTAQVVAYPG